MRIFILLTFVMMYGCEIQTKELPVLSYTINQEGDKTIYSITYENFTNQLGDAFSTEDLKNKVYIANFFFTSCPSICPPMRDHLIKISEVFENKDEFMIVSHTIDPENDTTEILNNYSESTHIPINRWQFLRASDDKLRAQANLYMTNFKPNEDGTDFYHSSYVALVDDNQLIRGFYNILVEEEVYRLIEDIELLLH